MPDPLHNKEPTLRVIIEKGGDYLVGTKDNTSNRVKAVQTALEGTPLFDLSIDRDHGRFDIRRAAVRPLKAIEVQLLSASSAVGVQREWIVRSRLEEGQVPPPEEVHLHTRHFISSRPPEEAIRLGTAAREHWSVENKNHHKRDDSVWQEDRHRFGRVNIAQNLALTRNALLAIIPFDEKRNLPSLIIDYQDSKQPAIDLVLKAHPFP